MRLSVKRRNPQLVHQSFNAIKRRCELPSSLFMVCLNQVRLGGTLFANLPTSFLHRFASLIRVSLFPHIMRVLKVFAIGHLALGYLLGKTSARLLKLTPNIPLILLLSVVPDVDIILEHFGLFEHRGATHSLITALVVFLPFFVMYRKKTIPYFVSMVQHTLIGDYIAGGEMQLFWPITTNAYGTTISLVGAMNMFIEVAAFAVAIIVMFKTKDLALFFKSNMSNLVLVVPGFAVLGSILLSYPYVRVFLLLILPHMFYVAMFSSAILLALFKVPERIKLGFDH
jgi:membrane-bound metal-dependent hydrolase YbcI (DUF457 family)